VPASLDTSNGLEDPEEESEEEEERAKMIPAKRISRLSGGNSVNSKAQNLRRIMEPEGSEYDEDEDDFSEDGEEESTDERVKRLKQLYKTSPTLKRFGGITRSDES
jgi:rubrerythrin